MSNRYNSFIMCCFSLRHHSCVVFLQGGETWFHLSVREREDVCPMAAVELVSSEGSCTDVDFCDKRSTEDFSFNPLDGFERVVVADNLGEFRVVSFERVNHSDCIVIVPHYFHIVYFFCLFVVCNYITETPQFYYINFSIFFIFQLISSSKGIDTTF